MCAERGARVSLLCLTHGEHGPGVGPVQAPRLGEVRAQELRDAARVLGIERVEVLGHEDGMLPWLDAAVLEADIRDAILHSEADVVVTFDEDGLYWHPDHVAVHQRTTAAVAELGPGGPALRYVSMPPGAMRAVAAAAPGTPILGVEDVDGFGASAPAPTFVVDAGSHATRKLEALCCHRSQVAGGPLDVILEEDAARLLGLEHYRCAAVGSPDPACIDFLGTPLPARV